MADQSEFEIVQIFNNTQESVYLPIFCDKDIRSRLEDHIKIKSNWRLRIVNLKYYDRECYGESPQNDYH